jgi:hypothetical protein
LSEERLQPRFELWLAEAETEAERERLRRISRTPQEALVGVFDELERRYGGATEFLRGARLGESRALPGSPSHPESQSRLGGLCNTEFLA